MRKTTLPNSKRKYRNKIIKRISEGSTTKKDNDYTPPLLPDGPTSARRSALHARPSTEGQFTANDDDDAAAATGRKEAARNDRALAGFKTTQERTKEGTKRAYLLRNRLTAQRVA